MARYGLNLGEKFAIFDKQYRILNDIMLDPSEQLGELTFVDMTSVNTVYEDDLNNRNQDGTYRQIATGEVNGFDVALISSNEKQVFVTITDMPLSAFEDLGIEFGDKVTLSDIVVTYSQVGSGEAKLFASAIQKAGQAKPQPQKPENNQNQEPKEGK